jgi:cellulose synthase/poly-beta-1,6-N-acetylglucosamine synthase-like glycosyltransferase
VARQGATVRRVRPAVDVVVPFRGSAPALAELVERLHGLALEPGDTVTVVDNTPAGVAYAPTSPGVRVVAAPERRSSYHARNRGAAAGAAPWLLFLDADVEPAPALPDRYLEEAPGARTGVLVGTVRDVASASGPESFAGRYARVRRLIDQANTLQMARPYAKTANCLVRRAAFEQVGGFVDDIRSGGDADLCFRLREAGWELEPRPAAVAEHRSRQRLLGLLGQRARHGSGAEWLELRYPGFVGPRRRLVGLARNLVEGAGASAAALVRGDGEQALVRLMDPVSNAAFDLGRRIPNETWREQPLLRRVRGRPA